MMIEIFSNLQKENESEDSLYEKFQQAEKRYAELQQKYKEVKAKYDAWCKGLDES
jgi:chromosome segregation ATPase